MALTPLWPEDVDVRAEHEMEPLEKNGLKIEVSQPKSINLPSGGAIRIIKTCSLFMNFILLLSAGTQTMAALVDLASYFSVDFTKISIVQSAGCLSYVAGTWLGGLLYSRVNVFALLSCFSLCSISAFASCVFMPGVVLFILVASFSFLCGGAIDAVVNSYFLALWEGHRLRDSLMQAMHSSWSAGVMSMGAMLKPFLNPDLQAHRNVTTSSIDTSLSTNFSSNESLSSQISHRVQYAYILFACLGVLPLCSHVALFIWDSQQKVAAPREIPSSPKAPSVQNVEENNVDKVANENETSLTACKKLHGRSALIMVAFAVLVRIFDVELFVSAFLPSYLFYGLNWSTPDASVAFSVFFAGQFSGRLLSVIVSAFVKPIYILMFDSGLVVSSGIILALFGHVTIIPYLTSFVMGIGNSSSFPSVFLWISSFTPITGLISASLFLGELVTLLSPSFAYVIETKWPAFYVVFISVSGFLCLCSLIVGHFVGLRLLRNQKSEVFVAEETTEADPSKLLVLETVT